MQLEVRWKESYISLGFISHCQDVTASTLASNPNTSMNVHADGSRDIFNLTTLGDMTFGMVMDIMYRTQIKIAAAGLRPELIHDFNVTFSTDCLHVVVARKHPNASAVDIESSVGDTPSKYFKEP
jgi:hypothetical protein